MMSAYNLNLNLKTFLCYNYLYAMSDSKQKKEKGNEKNERLDSPNPDSKEKVDPKAVPISID